MPDSYQNIVGRRFGMLTVCARVFETPSDGPKWSCRCDCGKVKVIRGNALRRGQHSCGCVSLGKRTHNMSQTRAHRIWCAMRLRCNDPSNSNYPRWGGRGISVCERWEKFENFLADMGFPPDGLTIERIDNNGNYEPGNCRWATRFEQAQNKRDTRLVNVGGETVSMEEAARRLGMSGTSLGRRLDKGRDIHAPKGMAVCLTFNDQTLNLSQRARKLGVQKTTLSQRRKKGWPVERILREIAA